MCCLNPIMPEHCRVCGDYMYDHVRVGQLMGVQVKYYDCNKCSYVQTQKPYWLDKAYSEPINVSDTGIMSRNLLNLELVIATLALLGVRKSRVVDCAGGYGLLVRMLRDIGVDAYWKDAYAQNLVCNGFEYNGEGAKLVTAFEAFEHFVDPVAEIDRLLEIAPNILITTTFIPSPAPLLGEWWYYGLEHGQHIGFFRKETMGYLAKKNGLHFMTDGSSIHLLTSRRVSNKMWLLFRKLAKLDLRLLTCGLRSKTWDDHLKMCKVFPWKLM